MKIAVFSLYSAMLALTASAEAPRYIPGSSVWTRNGEKLDFLATKGMEMEAIDEALKECRKEGHAYCVLKNVQLLQSFESEGELQWGRMMAQLHGLSAGTASPAESFSGSDYWKFGRNEVPSDRARMAVRRQALEKALSDCYRSEHSLCAIESTSLEPAKSKDGAEVVSARATVRGLRSR
jgi:hypothetical protein